MPGRREHSCLEHFFLTCFPQLAPDNSKEPSAYENEKCLIRGMEPLCRGRVLQESRGGGSIAQPRSEGFRTKKAAVQLSIQCQKPERLGCPLVWVLQLKSWRLGQKEKGREGKKKKKGILDPKREQEFILHFLGSIQGAINKGLSSHVEVGLTHSAHQLTYQSWKQVRR